MQFINRCLVLVLVLAFGFSSIGFAVTLPAEKILKVHNLGPVNPENGLPVFTDAVPEQCRKLVVYTIVLDEYKILRSTAQAMCRPVDFPVPDGYGVDVRVDMGKYTQNVPVQFWIYSVSGRITGVFYEAQVLDDSAWAEAFKRFPEFAEYLTRTHPAVTLPPPAANTPTP